MVSGTKPRTKKNYSNEFHEWFTFIDMTPTEQIKKRMHDLTTQNIAERLFFENKWRTFKEYLEIKGDLKHASMRTRLRTMASFFSRNGLPLNLKRGDRESTQEQPIIQRWKITKEEVKAMYSHGNLRDRTLLLVLAQSGFSEVDVSQMKIENLKGIYEQSETEHYFIEKPREKTGEVQATCLSYEAIHDIQSMLQERDNPQEGYLFVSTIKGKGSKLAVRTIHNAMKGLAEKTFGAERAKEFKTKALRSFYNSALLRADIKSEVKDLMMGHARQSARKHYDYDDVTIREAYQRAFEYLSINGIQTRLDVKRVMTALKGVQDANIVFQKELDKRAKEMEELKRTIVALKPLLDVVTNLKEDEVAKFILKVVPKSTLEEEGIEVPDDADIVYDEE